MTDPDHTAPASRWNTLYSNYLTLIQKLEGAHKPHERDALERAHAACQEDLLDTPTPHLMGLRAKAYVLFEGQMHGLDAQSEQIRLFVEDLENIIGETAGLCGLPAPQLSVV